MEETHGGVIGKAPAIWTSHRGELQARFS